MFISIVFVKIINNNPIIYYLYYLYLLLRVDLYTQYYTEHNHDYYVPIH